MLSIITDIKTKRKELNITQGELAEVTGLHQAAITRIESGKIDCRISTLQLLSAGLHTIEDARRRKLAGVVIISKTDFENSLYRSMIKELEHLEHTGKYQGNGHHLAQRLIEMISKEVGVKKED
jgi:predicted transcriptional regulator